MRSIRGRDGWRCLGSGGMGRAFTSALVLAWARGWGTDGVGAAGAWTGTTTESFSTADLIGEAVRRFSIAMATITGIRALRGARGLDTARRAGLKRLGMETACAQVG